jgi:hypothetical protein
MPSKRDVLALLTRDELLAVVDRFELAPPDRRAKDGLVDTVASSKRATRAEVLPVEIDADVRGHGMVSALAWRLRGCGG